MGRSSGNLAGIICVGIGFSSVLIARDFLDTDQEKKDIIKGD